MWQFKKKQKQSSSNTEETYMAPTRRPPALLPPTDPLLDTPWRILDWEHRCFMKEDLRRLQISTPEVQSLRILVHGPVGAGKSSFINSIDSIFQERMTNIAPVDAVSGHSFTKKLHILSIKDGDYHALLPFVICDIMGLESGLSEGVDTNDLVKVLEGHIKDDYMFNPAGPCSENDHKYNCYPMLKDRIHCLVSVIPADKISMMDDAVINKMREVRAKASHMRIPQVAVLTNVDKMCPRVAKDIKLIYRSKKIRDQMKKCSHRLGVPLNCIFPVQNYHEEIHLNDEEDVLLLSALTFILNSANDHVAAMAPPPGAYANYHVAERVPPPGDYGNDHKEERAPPPGDDGNDHMEERVPPPVRRRKKWSTVRDINFSGNQQDQSHLYLSDPD